MDSTAGATTGGVDRKLEHKHNVSQKMAGVGFADSSAARKERHRVLLQGTVDAMRAKFARFMKDITEEVDFMEGNIPEMVDGVEYGVSGAGSGGSSPAGSTTKK